jgi:hypothetical protein
MKMKQCANGHFFDQAKNQTCPYCKNLSPSPGAQDERRGSKTVGIMQEKEPACAPPLAAETPKAQEPAAKTDAAAGGHTVAIIEQKLGMDPVVGWLVCIEGKEKGRDFRIRADNNFIGRDESMDIALTFDETVSRRNHAVISFDPQTGIFYFTPDEGRSIIRHNGNPVFSTVELLPKDELTIGMTKLLFVPLCGKDFSWD